MQVRTVYDGPGRDAGLSEANRRLGQFFNRDFEGGRREAGKFFQDRPKEAADPLRSVEGQRRPGRDIFGMEDGVEKERDEV